ncbi:hypothetical protein QF031_000031 [Pseudarthrobacter defluvii]|uniref:DUF4255 domain-containing protein n=1 Tax=Pseudarthrobacter defluvii TaxID=410837 RepID=UPI0027869209|nr:DUF4255 domain-containing protein [Pseudarthrobacter defluvii]MDQ0767282.1 hypothetical protein [Pseudarthrobacter defluvii]
MANHLAIATATEALRLRLDSAIKPEFSGVDVVARRPDAGDGLTASVVTVFLYRITPNGALRNSDLPTRGSDGKEIRQRPRAAFDLHYLLSFSGDDEQLVPQRMLGRSVETLHSRPMLGRAELAAATQGEPWLAESNLAEEIESVKFTMAALSLDDLAKIWSVFLQVPYRISAAFEASVVLIESDLPARVPLPVRRRGVDTLPVRQPLIERIAAVGAPAEGGPGDGAVVGSGALELEITGRHLRGPVTLVRFDDEDPQPVLQASDRRLIVSGASLSAGRHGVQVVHDVLIGDPPTQHHGVESAAAAFVLRPAITAELVLDADTNPDPAGDAVEVTFTPLVRPGQRVVLLLNEYADPAPAEAPRFFQLEPEAPPTAPMDKLRFLRGPVSAGTYLVRVQVDGAESFLDLHLDTDPQQPPSPQVTVP